MAEKTKITWTDATFNPVWGCHKVSPACDHCYAERDSKRFAGGKVLWGVNAERREFGDKHWNEPLRWARTLPKKLGRRPRIFCASMADVFDKNWPEGTRDRLWKLIDATPELDWLLLTKRVGNVRGMVPMRWLAHGGWPKHARIGSTVINQPEADRDIPKVLALECPNFLSIEPMLGAIDLSAWLPIEAVMPTGNPWRRRTKFGEPDSGLHWVICGGESGPSARPMHPDWARSLRDQCAAAGVPFHFKQWGEWGPSEAIPIAAGARDCPAGTIEGVSANLVLAGHGRHVTALRVGTKAAGRLLDGIEHNGLPT